MKLLTQNRIKTELHWSLTLIKRYLPIPDKVTDNPHNASRYPLMKLFDIDRINKTMANPDFKRDFKKSNERSQKIQATKLKNRKSS